MLFDVSMILYLFIYLDEELVWMECCGALQLVQRGSSMALTSSASRSDLTSSHSSSSHLFLLLVFMFLLVYPLAATPLFSTMLACSAERRVLVCTIGTSPLSMQ